MMELRHVTVRVGKSVLLDDVSLEARAGEVLAVVGPNGAGKTTLLKVLAGERAPDHGEVHMARRPLSEWTLRERARVRAVVSQEVLLEFPFSVLDVTLMGRTPHIERTERPVDESIALSALRTVGMAHFSERSYPTLSGGERQRVHLARALAQIAGCEGERYLLLDEATSSLDVAHQHQVLSIVRRLARERGVVVAILHDLNLAAQYGDRLLLLKEGRSLATGVPKAVLNESNIRRAFGIETVVMAHPRLPVPLVVPIAVSESSAKENTA
jgi:iron complex transport system ATP-binding protein